jgi:hypothetical protein
MLNYSVSFLDHMENLFFLHMRQTLIISVRYIHTQTDTNYTQNSRQYICPVKTCNPAKFLFDGPKPIKWGWKPVLINVDPVLSS